MIRDLEVMGSTSDYRTVEYKHLWTNRTHRVSSVTKQYDLVPVKGRWRPTIGRVTVGPASCWPCVTSFRFSGLDRCHIWNFIARFCFATLSRDKIANVTWRVAQLINSRATSFPITAALYSVQLCREKCGERWLVSSCLCHKVAMCDTACHACDFVAR